MKMQLAACVLGIVISTGLASAGDSAGFFYFGQALGNSSSRSVALGDLDGDGDLDSEDYLLIVDQLGICTADLNGDGVVDGIDLATVLGAWGLPCDG